MAVVVANLAVPSVVCVRNVRVMTLQLPIPLSVPKATTWRDDLQEPDGIVTNVILHSKDLWVYGAPIATTTYVIPVASLPRDAAP